MKSGKVFCIDSSLLMALHHYYPQAVVPSIWDLLGDLFISGSAFSHRLVFDEVYYNQEHPDALAQWIIPFKAYFVGKTDRQWELVPGIVRKHPKLIDPSCKKEQADPWLVALLMEEQEKRTDPCILVTQESEKSSDKLPAACRSFGLQSVNLITFFMENEWAVNVTPRKARGDKR
jgi:hypothetical protein